MRRNVDKGAAAELAADPKLLTKAQIEGLWEVICAGAVPKDPAAVIGSLILVIHDRDKRMEKLLQRAIKAESEEHFRKQQEAMGQDLKR